MVLFFSHIQQIGNSSYKSIYSLQRIPHKKQIGIGAAVAGGALATGLIAHHVLKKRKAKKEADREAQNLKECMIDLVQEGEYIYISESDILDQY